MSHSTDNVSTDIRLGIVRGISYGLFGKPDVFVPPVRALGAGLLRVYLFWGQVEPRPGQFTWETVDALLDQLDGDEEVWITLCSSSLWATRQPTDFLPPSPAHSLDAYAEFVRQVVRRCAGRVKYWQCDNEPSNTPLLWDGTAVEYVAQLQAMYRAVKAVAPNAEVVLGGCGYDVLSSEAGSAQRHFFDQLASFGDAFDVFDVHLYGDPYKIPDYLETARQLMLSHGYLKPIVVGEYGGPSLFEFPDVEAALQTALAAAFATAAATQSTEALKAQASQDTPERLAMKELYSHLADLPPKLQMFMDGCPPALEARRHRIACRQMIMRNLLALSEGIRRTLYWNLAPEVPGRVDPYSIMHLLIGKLPLLDYRGNTLAHRHPEAKTFALLARQLGGVEYVSRVPMSGQPTVYTFRVERRERPPVYVMWDRRDAFDGESEPPIRVSLTWPTASANAIDAFGNPLPTTLTNGELWLELSDTPVFVTAE